MNLKAEILKEHSKKQTQKIVVFIGNNNEKFDALMQLFFHDEYPVIQRAAWAVSECCDKFPELILPYLEEVILYLKKPNIHDAVKRNMLRIMQSIDIPENLLGSLISICFNFLENHKEPIAVRVFSMSVLANAALKFPELKNELLTLIEIEFQQEEIKPAFVSRAKKVIKLLRK